MNVKDLIQGDIENIPKTALDVFRILPEGTLCEVIDNVLYMSPAPKYDHQSLLFFLARKIADHSEKLKIGEVMIAPFDVYFDSLLSAVQPDIIFVLKENRDILKKDGYIHGAPDLIVEILSKDKTRDLVTKKNLYEKAGVKEYYTVNPVDKKIQSWQLINDKYSLVYKAEGKFKSAILSLEFDF